MRTLWLASGSPRRAQLLQQIGTPFERLPAPGVDESLCAGETPRDYVLRLAADKARAGWSALSAEQQADAAVLGADTSVVLADQVLGKPESAEQAQSMLSSLSGNEHLVLTAVSLVWQGQQESRVSETRVRFRTLGSDEMQRYIRTGEGSDKAGGYGIQGFGALLVDSIEGSYSGVVGLPLELLPELLSLAAIDCWRSPDRGA